MYEIEENIADYKLFLRWKERFDFTRDPNVNYNRQYSARFNPINTKLMTNSAEFIHKMESTAGWTLAEQSTNLPEVIFNLPGMSYAVITLDLRHIQEEIQEWTYNEDWAISITMEEDMELNQIANPLLMPETFLSHETSKAQTIEFLAFAWRDLKLRVDILIYNGLYTNFKYLFTNSTSVEIRQPSRARYGKRRAFCTRILFDYQISLPMNLPKLLP